MSMSVSVQCQPYNETERAFAIELCELVANRVKEKLVEVHSYGSPTVCETKSATVVKFLGGTIPEDFPTPRFPDYGQICVNSCIHLDPIPKAGA